MVFNTKFNQSTHLNVKKINNTCEVIYSSSTISSSCARSLLQPPTMNCFTVWKWKILISWTWIVHMRPDGFKVRVRLSSRLGHTALVASSGIHPPAAWASCLRGAAYQKNVGLNCEDINSSHEKEDELRFHVKYFCLCMNGMHICIKSSSRKQRNSMERFHYPHVLSLPLTPHASLTPKHFSLSLPPLSHHNLSVDEVTECEKKKTAFHWDRERDPPVQEK